MDERNSLFGEGGVVLLDPGVFVVGVLLLIGQVSDLLLQGVHLEGETRE